MHKKLIAMLIVLAFLVAPSVAFAGGTCCQASSWTEGKTYSEKTFGKLSFGLKNALLGWVDVFYEPYKADKNDKSVLGGIGKGLFDLVANEIGGAVHFVTFPIPVDLPLPDGGLDLSE